MIFLIILEYSFEVNQQELHDDDLKVIYLPFFTALG